MASYSALPYPACGVWLSTGRLGMIKFKMAMLGHDLVNCRYLISLENVFSIGSMYILFSSTSSIELIVFILFFL